MGCSIYRRLLHAWLLPTGFAHQFPRETYRRDLTYHCFSQARCVVRSIQLYCIRSIQTDLSFGDCYQQQILTAVFVASHKYRCTMVALEFCEVILFVCCIERTAVRAEHLPQYPCTGAFYFFHDNLFSLRRKVSVFFS